MLHARVMVSLKKPVLDPQGVAIQRSLKSLGIESVMSVRQGKTFDIELGTDDKDQAQKILSALCEKLLANPVIEDYNIEIL